ncbi:metallopeptidase [Rhodococcus sp. D2-41]|uniref:glycoside hydrolase family 25 protein n=1 Tax=Speluncibacter jeojiensis TaxID=2710754 RepID=UPI00240FD925|nr:glycoside hydrolase family 25 protein [Rhodococcus sp. D2-41]MDG3012367.1 metallopeptidase [Rhodococcus sp. D2-41]
MTIFGIDISSYQAGLDLAQVKAEGFDFVFVKVTEGSGYVNPTWPGFRDAANANGLVLVGYHYLTTDDVNAQADNFVRNRGPNIPAMIDFEANGGTLGNFWAFVNAVNALGVQIALSYIPRWYIQGAGGGGDLSQVPGLISSSYVSGSGYASALYPGDQSSYWDGYDGGTPAILQFTDSAQVAGQTVDANAFRGNPDQLRALLAQPAGAPAPPSAPTQEDTMTPDQDAILRDIQVQLRGPGCAGWPQLGTNAAGQNLTLVDALAEALKRIEALESKAGVQA